jgi:hypothetical protein
VTLEEAVVFLEDHELGYGLLSEALTVVLPELGRFYNADGTHENLAPSKVVELRKAAAQELGRVDLLRGALDGLLTAMDDHLLGRPPEEVKLAIERGRLALAGRAV